MFWLLVLGALHYYLIWYGDILTLYAMVGMIAFLFRKLSVRALLFWALGLLAFDLLFMAGGAWHFFTAEAAARAPGASAAAIAEWRRRAASSPSPAPRHWRTSLPCSAAPGSASSTSS